MDCEDLSDLEEGEIFEYENCSPRESKNETIGRERPHILMNGTCEEWFKYSKNKDEKFCFSKQEKGGYLNIDLKEKVNLTCRHTDQSLVNEAEYISSDGEYRSEVEEKEKFISENKDLFMCRNNQKHPKKRLKKKPPGHLSYGTVEDIMSEIGETISRKTRCDYKRRKSREVKYNLPKFYAKEESSYGKMFSSHYSNLKIKKRRRKMSCSDSDLEVLTKEEVLRNKRCRRKAKKESLHQSESDDDDGVVTKKNPEKQIRDFDEVRRNLLEKLKKQKAEESKAASLSIATQSEQDLESSDIQEVEMLIDCTNYVDSPSAKNETESRLIGHENLEDGGEDELDVIKLRLIALASNRKQKNLDVLSKTENCSERKDGSRDLEDGDLDRNELLLRAEALKTALLKKHQKRLNKLKGEKMNGVGSSSDNDGIDLPSPLRTQTEAGVTEESGEKNSDSGDLNPIVSNVPEVAVEKGARSYKVKSDQDIQAHANEKAVTTNSNVNKIHGRVRGKRKKKKSGSQPSKENSKQSEVLDEDDRALRSQLLSDLMKKKSLKDLEEKSVLMDSIQTSANRASLNVEGVQVKAVPFKRNALKKINLPKAKTLPVPVREIPQPQIQRIIVHLGSEDSSDEDGELETPSPDKQVLRPERAKEGKDESTVVRRPMNETIQASYEKSVELLLSQARKKVEGEMQTAKRNALDTPEAVYKHLPPSQRLEYIKLKQKIAERERLKKLRNEASGGSSVKPPLLPTLQTPFRTEEINGKLPESKKVTKAGILVGETPGVCKNSTANLKLNSNEHGGDKCRHFVGKTVNNRAECPLKTEFPNPLPNGRPLSNKLLLPASQALISKLKLLLKKIRIEKCIEENYEKEIAKLKGQLGLFEKKKCEQRFKIKKLAEESMKIYKGIQRITNPGQSAAPGKAEGVKGTEKKDEDDESEKDRGKETKLDTNKEADKEKEVKTKEEKDKKETFKGKAAVTLEEKMGISEVKGESEPRKELVGGTMGEGASPRSELLEYSSPLNVFSKASDRSERVDPNVIVCQFDLMGICKDEECKYQHFRAS